MEEDCKTDPELTGQVFDVQGYSVHDGPGGRTLVFMKGCPLACGWCSNPEGMRQEQDVMFRNTRCVNLKNGCTRCVEACPSGAITQNPDKGEDAQQLLIDRGLCSSCEGRECLEVCYFEALRACGERRSVADLIGVFDRNRHYWGERGGVSFSGGEPLLQYEFMLALLQACRGAGIHTTVETTAYIETEKFLELMNRIDFAFIDLKHMDAESHREMLGVSNDLILQNIEALMKTKWPGRLVLRTPIIEGYNDSDENTEATAAFMRRLGLFEINILPFHRLGASKWTQLGREYRFEGFPATSEKKLLRIQDIYLGKRIACYVGADTPF